jgi:tRNA(Ile)-lysidine synthase TilS/MesJ
MTTDRVLGKVEKFLLTCEGLDRGVLVGVSGGADSICLTHALFRLGSQGLFSKMLIMACGGTRVTPIISSLRILQRH